jgi:hypothetical protein
MATDVILLDSISTLAIPVSKAAFRIIERQPIESSPRVAVVDITLKINRLLTFNSLQDFGIVSETGHFYDNTALGIVHI